MAERALLCNSDCSPTLCGDGILNATAGESLRRRRQRRDGARPAARPSARRRRSAATPSSSSARTAIAVARARSVTPTARPRFCGDGTLNVTAGEICDGGGETAACDLRTAPTAFCGDSTVNATALEVCDDGGESAACDGRLHVRVLRRWPGERRAQGEDCDTSGESASCNADCTTASAATAKVNAGGGRGLR